MSDNDSSVGGFGWFLAGLGIGALVGVLYAPKSGKETRDELMQSALEARDKANDLYNQGKDQASQYMQQGVDRGKEYYDKGRTQWSQYVDKGKDLVQSQTDAVTAAVNAGKQAYTQKTTDSPQTPQA